MPISLAKTEAFQGWAYEATPKNRALWGWAATSTIPPPGTWFGSAALYGEGFLTATPPAQVLRNIMFGGYELSQYGLTVSQIAGWLDLVPVEYERLERYGAAPYIADRRRRLPTISLEVMVSAADRSSLLSTLATLKQRLSPERGFQKLVRYDVPDRCVYARSLGFPISESNIPFIARQAIFGIEFERLGFEEDVDEQVATVSTAQGTITNSGDLEVDVTWVCTLSQNMATGLQFTVNSQVFWYKGALVAGDVLTVRTEVQDVELGNVSRFSDVATDAVYPRLQPGSNTVALSDATKFSLQARYYRRYE